MMTAIGRTTFRALGTDIVVLTTDHNALDTAERMVHIEVDRIDRTCSRFRDDSDLSRVNANAGKPTSVDPDFIDALEVAIRAAHLTNGIVDPTIGHVVRALGYDRDFATIEAHAPAPTATVRVMRVPGWQVIDIDRSNLTVTIPRGAQLDLGATAKALAADRAAVAAHHAAGCGVLVNFGGDLRVEGPPPSSGWDIRMTDWQASPTCALGQTVTITSGALATSSTTVRRWQQGNKAVHHLIDPATADSCAVVWRTASIAAATCVDANIASTASIIMGSAAIDWVQSIGLPARFVAVDGTATTLCGWEAA